MVELTQNQIERIGEEVATNPEINYTTAQLEQVPQEYFNQRVANGLDLFDCPGPNIFAVPQEYWNKRVAQGVDPYDIPQEKLSDVPQECWMEYLANGGVVTPYIKDTVGDISPESQGQPGSGR